jgi:cell filamentation protein, protein adenylyltransferase
MHQFVLQELPLSKEMETVPVLRKLASTHRYLAELKGQVASISDAFILINTLGIQEAKDSSTIENIITTHDELYKSELNLSGFSSSQAKEVWNYVAALKTGFQLISERGLLTSNDIITIQTVLENNNAGFRTVPGTVLKNAATGETVYTPPQDIEVIQKLMANLEMYINNNAVSDLDPLVKMAIIHYQFESIHPFYDGNGRTGRIINVLYLVLNDLLGLPVLYLSRYIVENKEQYYKLLQHVRENDEWEKWIMYVLSAVENTAKQSLILINQIRDLVAEYKNLLRGNYKFYSQDLLNNLFTHPYTKIEFIQRDLGVSRITAANYLNKLAEDGVLRKEKLGTGNYYVNTRLFELLAK